jgi:hypothetical protein
MHLDWLKLNSVILSMQLQHHGQCLQFVFGAGFLVPFYERELGGILRLSKRLQLVDQAQVWERKEMEFQAQARAS